MHIICILKTHLLTKYIKIMPNDNGNGEQPSNPPAAPRLGPTQSPNDIPNFDPLPPTQKDASTEEGSPRSDSFPDSQPITPRATDLAHIEKGQQQ